MHSSQKHKNIDSWRICNVRREEEEEEKGRYLLAIQFQQWLNHLRIRAQIDTSLHQWQGRREDQECRTVHSIFSSGHWKHLVQVSHITLLSDEWIRGWAYKRQHTPQTQTAGAFPLRSDGQTAQLVAKRAQLWTPAKLTVWAKLDCTESDIFSLLERGRRANECSIIFPTYSLVSCLKVLYYCNGFKCVTQLELLVQLHPDMKNLWIIWEEQLMLSKCCVIAFVYFSELFVLV